MKKIRVGIIGCGGMGTLHSRILEKIGGVEIHAASDASEEALARFRERLANIM